MARLLKVPIDVATKVPDEAGQYLIFANYYWSYNPSDKDILFYSHSSKPDLSELRPQANADFETANRLTERMYPRRVSYFIKVVYLSKELFTKGVYINPREER